MFASAAAFFSAKQPGVTGALKHATAWALSDGKGRGIENPAYVSQWGVHPVAVYCVHGTADRPDAFRAIAEQVRDLGFPPEIDVMRLVAFEGRFTGRSIMSFAEELLQQIIQNGHCRVILMGHSRGGLVCAYLAEYLARKHNIEVLLVLTIGTPFQGSYLALDPLAWWSSSVEEMQENSTFLEDLSAHTAVSTVKYCCFVATDDWIVLKGASHIAAKDASASATVVHMKDEGHVSIMASEKTAPRIKDEMMGVLQRVVSASVVEETTADGRHARPEPDEGLPMGFGL